MVIEEGIVIELKEGQVLIQMDRTEGCEACPTAHVCQSDGNKMVMRAKDPLGATVGQMVKVSIEPANFIYPAFWVYGFPLLSLIGGGIAGNFLARWLRSPQDQLFSALGAVVGLVLSLFVVKRFNTRLEKGLEYLPIVIEIVH